VPWRLTVRAGPRVERTRYDDLDQALDAAERRAREIAGKTPRQAVDARYKRFEPAQIVAARVELAGPERLLPSRRAGIDVHGDGTTIPYLGRVKRQVVKQRQGETAYRALRRALQNS